jgi:hypothetical protein
MNNRHVMFVCLFRLRNYWEDLDGILLEAYIEICLANFVLVRILNKMQMKLDKFYAFFARSS